MFLLAAAALQTAELPADTVQAALTCGAAVHVVADPGELSDQMRWVYLASFAARKAGPNADLDANVDEVLRRQTEIAPQAPALVALCRTRFPKAWSPGPVVLPSDSYQRRLICFSAAAAMNGVMRSIKTWQGRPVDRDTFGVRALRFKRLLSDADFVAHGIRDSESVGKMIREVGIAAADGGTMEATFLTCETVFPA